MRKRLTGVVTGDKMNKSLRVEIERRFRHPRYGKIIRGRTVCYAHDEENKARLGDTVEIIEGRPRSKMKRWELVRVVKTGVDVADVGDALPAEDEPAGGNEPATPAE